MVQSNSEAIENPLKLLNGDRAPSIHVSGTEHALEVHPGTPRGAMVAANESSNLAHDISHSGILPWARRQISSGVHRHAQGSHEGGIVWVDKGGDRLHEGVRVRCDGSCVRAEGGTRGRHVWKAGWCGDSTRPQPR